MNKKYNSKKFLQKKKKLKKIKIWCFSVLFLILLIGFVYLMRHPRLNIDEVKILNNNFSKSESLKASVIDSLNGNFMFLIPKTNALILPRFETQQKIKEGFPEVEEININLKNLNEIEVEILEYDPKIILKKDKQEFFVNKEGVAFLRAPAIHPFDSLDILMTESESVEIGEGVIESDFLKRLLEFISNLSKVDIDIVTIENTNQNVYTLMTDRGFEMIISTVDDLDIAFENISTILENDALKDTDLDKVEYVDLRFGNKVFYKFRD